MENDRGESHLPLTERQNEIALLWNQGKTYTQIGKIIGMTRGGVASMLSSARKKGYPLRKIESQLMDFEWHWNNWTPIWRIKEIFDLDSTWDVRLMAYQKGLPERDYRQLAEQ